jgi:hypothetical protein
MTSDQREIRRKLRILEHAEKIGSVSVKPVLVGCKTPDRRDVGEAVICRVDQRENTLPRIRIRGRRSPEVCIGTAVKGCMCRLSLKPGEIPWQ